LPEVHLYSSQFDVLRDEALDWAEYLRGSRVPLAHKHFDDMPHDFCLYGGAVPEVTTYLDHIARSLSGAPLTIQHSGGGLGASVVQVP
jgi:acetyl esterase/lipase